MIRRNYLEPEVYSRKLNERNARENEDTKTFIKECKDSSLHCGENKSSGRL